MIPNWFTELRRLIPSDTLPEIPVGIPSGGTACDRCEDQTAQLGEVLFGAITDATGAFTIEEYVPVGQEFTLVVKAGKFRRAIKYTVPKRRRARQWRCRLRYRTTLRVCLVA